MKIKQVFAFVLLLAGYAGADAQKITFKKIVVDSTFVSAGVTVADIDKDGYPDIVAGDVWYKGPQWKRYEVRPLGTYYPTLVDSTKPRGSGASYYSRSIGNYTKDVDGDGWLDVIIFNSQGNPCYWYRNPKGNYSRYWQEYTAIDLFHNESPQMVDLFGDGDSVILAGHHIGNDKYTLSWFSIPADPTKRWQPHVIGHPDNFNYKMPFGKPQYFAPGGMGHGLGIGDIDGDGRPDVITAMGWYKAPPDARTKENWTFYPFAFDSLADPKKINLLFAEMFVDDFDGDGDADVIGGSAHAYGLWWFEQIKKDGKIGFLNHEITMSVSQLHAMNEADFDGDGKKEYVSGKRYLAHLGRDPGEFDPAVLLYVEQQTEKGKTKLQAYVIDDNSGSGTQIWIADINNDKKPDIITSNKKGTNIFLQQ